MMETPDPPPPVDKPVDNSPGEVVLTLSCGSHTIHVPAALYELHAAGYAAIGYVLLVAP